MRQNVRLRYQKSVVFALDSIPWIRSFNAYRFTPDKMTRVGKSTQRVPSHRDQLFCQHCGGKRGASHGEQWSSCSSASTGCALTCGFMRLRAFLFYSFGVTEILFHGFLVNLTTIIIPVIEYENNHIRQEGDLLKIKQSYRCRLFFY